MQGGRRAEEGHSALDSQSFEDRRASNNISVSILLVCDSAGNLCDGNRFSSVTNAQGKFGFMPKGRQETLINPGLLGNNDELLKFAKVIPSLMLMQ